VTVGVAPAVAAMTRSAAASSSPTRSRGTARLPSSRARAAPVAGVRLATTSWPAPASWTAWPASRASPPAPTSRTRRPARSPSCPAATRSPTETVERWPAPMPVWLRARRPTLIALVNKADSTGPTVRSAWAAANASRTWPRIWASPTTIESTPAATPNRCRTARSS